MRWEMFKAHIRGEIISYTRPKVKQQRVRMETLEKQIKSLEISVNVTDNPGKHGNLLLLRAENNLSVEKVVKSLMRLKQSYYDQGGKAGKLLAWRVKKIQSESNSIMTPSENLSIDPLEINNSFREFYESLYRSECPQTTEKRDTDGIC